MFLNSALTQLKSHRILRTVIAPF